MKIGMYLFIFIIVAIDAAKISYEGYKVYDVVPRNKGQVRILTDLNNLGVVVNWNDYLDVNLVAKVMVSRENQRKFRIKTEAAQIEVKEIISDLQSEIQNTLKPATPLKHQEQQSFYSMLWNRYYNLEDINSWLDRIAYNFPKVVKTVILGRSYEGRNTKGIVINYNRQKKNKLIGVIESGIHGREWVAPATATWIIKEFLSNKDSHVNALAKNFEWHILPVTNPDGYTYSVTRDRLWRKNRNSSYDRACARKISNKQIAVGVDLNRNFGTHWGGYGASTNLCTVTFAGSEPFSESETRYLSKYLEELQSTGKIVYYISLHSYSQSILLPYGYSIDHQRIPKHYDVMHKIAVNGVKKLKQRYGTNYKVGTPRKILYPMSGCSLDWVKKKLHVPFVCGVQLRNNKTFLLPATQIIPNCQEVMDFLVGMDEAAQELGLYVPTIPSSASINLQAISIVLNSFFCLFILYLYVCSV